jgi:hypothetical protein
LINMCERQLWTCFCYVWQLSLFLFFC